MANDKPNPPRQKPGIIPVAGAGALPKKEDARPAAPKPAPKPVDK